MATGCTCTNATVIDLQAEAMWPRSNALDFTITTPVIGLPRTVVVQRCARAAVDLVVRDDLAIWPPAGSDSAPEPLGSLTGKGRRRRDGFRSVLR